MGNLCSVLELHFFPTPLKRVTGFLTDCTSETPLRYHSFVTGLTGMVLSARDASRYVTCLLSRGQSKPTRRQTREPATHVAAHGLTMEARLQLL